MLVYLQDILILVLIIPLISKYLIKFTFSFINIFYNSIYKIKKGRKKGEVLNNITKEDILREFYYLIKITDMDELHYQRLDYNFKIFCRYSNIMTYQYNRVKIYSKNGYINASWVHIPYINCFIATQGPLIQTIDDFWEMCFQYNVKVIVMLCNLIEDKMEKCANYWDANLAKYKIIKTSNESQTDDGLIIRNFQIVDKNTYNSKNIMQIHLTTWDDHTAPISNYNKIITMINLIDNNKKYCPVVVHCSAGVGRTGSFIGLYNLYHEIIGQINNIYTREIKFSVLNLVRKLKEMRMHLVENEDQYTLLYEFAIILLNEKNIY